MFINAVLTKIQSIFGSLYYKSFLLQNIDHLIGLNIFFVIFSSVCAESDVIGYFALFAILLTAIKFFTKPNEQFDMNKTDICLLVYFLLVLISVSGSSLFYLSLKGFFKTVTYLGFYISVIHYLKDNRDKIKWIFISFALCACYETVFSFL